MARRVLVVHATRAGSTREVAEAVGEVLGECGLEVDVHPIGQVRDIAPYEAVVIGSAARMGKLLPEALRFARKHADELATRETAYFIVCMTMQDDTPANRDVVTAYLAPLERIREPVSTALFAGMYEPSTVGLLLRFIMSKMQVPIGDFRDWDEIRSWSRDLATRLSG